MNLKRFGALLLAVLVIAGTAFAGGGQEKSEKIVVKAMGYGDNSNQEGVTWKRIVDAFEAANPNIDIQDELLYDQAYHEKVTARLASGDVPDLAYMGADARWGLPWAEAGQQWDHRPYLDANYYDMSLIPPMGPNGEIWEVPLGTSNITTVLYANTKLLDEMGLALPKTYDDLKAMVPAAKAAGIEVITMAGAEGWVWNSCFLSAVIARTSGDPNWVSKAVAGENKFTDPAFVSALQLITTMIDDGVLDSSSVLIDYGSVVSKYSNGDALFMIDGQWRAGAIDPAVQEYTAMMAFPKLPDEKPGVENSVAAAISVGYGVTQAGAKDPAVRDAALKFINFFYSPEETTQRLMDGAIVAPVLKNFQIPDDLSTINKVKVKFAQETTNVTEVIDAFLAGDAINELNAGMQKIAAGDATAEEIAAKVEELARK